LNNLVISFSRTKPITGCEVVLAVKYALHTKMIETKDLIRSLSM
jgi:hypothetical protein